MKAIEMMRMSVFISPFLVLCIQIKQKPTHKNNNKLIHGNWKPQKTRDGGRERCDSVTVGVRSTLFAFNMN